MVAYCTGSNPVEIDDLELKVKVTVKSYPCFLHNSLFTSLVKMKVTPMTNDEGHRRMSKVTKMK